jgi:Lipid A 3-O-deacylase (PagL)
VTRHRIFVAFVNSYPFLYLSPSVRRDNKLRLRKGMIIGSLHVFSLLCGLFPLSGGPTVHAQAGPEEGGHELQVWTTGGYGVKGIASHTGVWTAGVRYGWVLTAPHGPGLLRGRLEYAVDAVPVFWLFQPTNTAYGAALNPFAMKWNFDTRNRIVPYAELGGGALFTNVQAPPGTSRVNFTSAGALGVHFLGEKFNWSADVRFMHISNAGISSVNPGINTMQLRLGLGLFTGTHHKN